MSYVYASVGIILAFVWAVFLLNEQRKEIVSLKAQLQVEQSYSQDNDNELSTCKADIDYLKNGLEDLIKAQEDMR